MKNYGSWDQFNTNRRVHGGTQRKIRMLCEPLRFRPSHKLYILTAMSTTGSTHTTQGRRPHHRTPARCFSIIVREQRGGGRVKQLTGAGISSILTAECAEERRKKQECSANLCGFKHNIDYIF